MPFYFDANRITTTNGTTQTESTHMAILTVANQNTAQIRALYGSMRFGTAGGGALRLYTGASAASGGTALTPNKRHPDGPAASTGVVDDNSAITPGGTLKLRQSVGLSQTGGLGGWIALESADAVTLKPNGGANGNAEVKSIANGVSVPVDIGVCITEGG